MFTSNTRKHAILFAVTMALLAFPAVSKASLYTDPTGDGGAGGPGQGVTYIDITSISVFFDSVNFYVTITFDAATPIAAPSAGLPNSVYGTIEFDTDQNTGTGIAPFQDGFRPAIGHALSGLGVEGAVVLFSEVGTPGFVDIEYLGSVVASVPITYTATSLSVTFARALFGGAGVVDFAAVVGDAIGPTDAAPGTFGTSSPLDTPEPSTLAMLGLAGSLMLVGVLRRK